MTQPFRYTYCPPASGSHKNRQGEGPIDPQVYGPDDYTEPAGWIHNLEHGALVLLYRCAEGDPGCTDEAQANLDDIAANFPNSPVCDVPRDRVGPVVARFDEMAWPYAALLWGRVLPLDTLDRDLIYRFFLEEAERTNPEQQCAPSAPPVAVPSFPASLPASAAPSPSSGSGASPAANGSPAAS